MCKYQENIWLGYNIERRKKNRQIVNNDLPSLLFVSHLTDMMLQNTAMEFQARLKHYWQY
jgi:predicted nucleotidyltransferase